LRSLTVEQIKNISNLSIFQVENIIRALETYSFPFIKKENDHYTLFSTDFLTHWPEMALWKKEELAHIHLYLSLHAKAVSYQNGIGELLSGSGLEEAFIWLNESNHNVHWACYYATAYELTIQFIEYAVSEKKKALEANQRRSKRLLKISRGIAFVIGFAFILSSLAAILAGIERNNALLSKKNAEVERKIAIRAKEQAVAAKEFAEMERKKALMASKAERIAKRLAENERLQAIVARDMANQEKINALISRNAEITAKEQAELDRSLAILARDVAENERKNAIEARLATDKALIQASTNFNRAEKLRKQQEARADALNAFRYYLNHQFMEGLTLSISAYAINNQNDGNRYEPEIFKSMVHGLTAVKPNTFSLKLKQPLKKITISPDGKLIAAYSIGGILTIFQPDFNIKKEINIPFQSFQSFCFTRDNHLLVGSSDGFISLYDIGSGNIKWSRFIAKAPIVSILHLREDKYIFGSGDNIFLLNGLLPISSLQKNTLPMEKTLGKITKGIDSDNIYVTVGNSVYAIKIKNDTFQITWKKIMEIPHIIQQIAFKEYQNQSYLILGDQKGNIYLVHATTGQLIFQKKAHQSSSTYCKLDLLNDDLLLISSGLDHKVMIDYLTKNEKDSFLLKSSVDFNLHSAWVTDMTYDTNTGNYFSCSDDMNVRKWNFNPVDIYNMAKAFLKDNNEYQAK
jgi:WD40 repeat protein